MLTGFPAYSVRSAIFLLALPLIAQTPEPAKSALERRGLFHATVQGRFVSAEGTPVAGVRVVLNAGRARTFPLVTALTGSDGRFVIRDVNSSYMPDLRWHPPERWLKGGIALAGESSGTIDVGTIRLQPDSVIRVSVEIVGGPALEARDREPTVVLQGKSQFGPRIVAETIGSYRVLRQIPFDEGNWEISLYTKGRSEYFRGPFHVQRGRRDQMLLIKLLRDTVKTQNQYSAEGKMEISEVLLPPATLERGFRASGRLLAPDGSPIQGAFVGMNDFFLARTPPQWTTSSTDGQFDLQYTSTGCTNPSVSYGDSDFIRLEGQTFNEKCDDVWKGPRDLVIAQASRLTLRVTGADAAGTRAFWWHDSFGWQQFSSLRPWISLSSFEQMAVKVEAPGFLPLIQTMELPSLSRVNGNDEKPPAEVPVDFHFDAGARRQLTVRAGGKPLPGATVDLEWIENLDRDSRRQVATYLTPADGKISLAGGADRIIEAFIYADGYEPRRARWNTGDELVLDLTPRDATLSFTNRESAALARVRPAGLPGSVRSVRLDVGSSSVKVAAGEYDITMYSDRGGVLGYQRLRVAAGETKTLDAAVDQRPRLTLHYSNAGWQSSVSDFTPRGGAVGWAAMITVGGTLSVRDVPATLIRETSEEAVYLLSRAGRVHIEMSRPAAPLLWRELEVRPGESLTVDVPHDEATIEGAMTSYETGIGNIHGIAGPRLQLIADDPSSWSVTDYLPAKEKDGTFRIRGIPPGNYHVYHHLIAEPKTYTFEGKTQTYTAPTSAWGGVPVKVIAGETAHLRDFASDPLGNLNVRILDASGRPLEQATIRIRDRMSDSWRQVEENPAQLEQAGQPIPYPASARIVAGRAMLPNIRSGWLEFAVETDAGPSYAYTMPVTLGQELQVTLPAGGAQ